MGAGVLPFAIDDTGKVQVLLGRERFMPSWKGSCRWSGFEGSRKQGESVTDTASREFFEESLAILLSKDHIDKMIERENFAMRIVLKIDHERRTERYHCTYVIRIPWDTTIPNKFHKVRSDIEHVDRLVQEWKHLHPNFLGEVSESIGPISERSDEFDKIAVVTRDVLSTPCIMRGPWEVLHNENSNHVQAKLYGKYAEDVLTWQLLRDRIDRALIDHPCIHVKRDSTFNLIQDVSVVTDYLEKDQIRWWSIAELHDVIQNRGHFRSERFRPYFMPVLQTFLSHIEEVSVISYLPADAPDQSLP